MEELTIEDKLAWRKKIRAVDANLHSVLSDAVAQEKANRPLFNRKKAEVEPEAEADATKQPRRGLRFGLPHAAS